MDRQYLLLKKSIQNDRIEKEIIREYRRSILPIRPTNPYSEGDNIEIISTYYTSISQINSIDINRLINNLYVLSCSTATNNNVKTFKFIIVILIKRNKINTLATTFRKIINNKNTRNEYVDIIKQYSNNLSNYYAVIGNMHLSVSFCNLIDEDLSLFNNAFIMNKKIDIYNIKDILDNLQLEFVRIYNEVLDKSNDTEINEELVLLSDRYIKLISRLDNDYIFEHYKIMAYFNYAIINNCTLSNLYYASIDNKKKDLSANSDIIRYLVSKSNNKSIRKMVSLMNSLDNVYSLYYDFNYFYATLNTANDIMNTLRLERVNRTAIYYTRFDTLLHMFPQKNTDEDGQYNGKVGRFSLMHYAYMNDPTEGKMLKKQFGHEIIEDNNISYPLAYLKCFTSRPDDIPMWEMYGDQAKGCCIFPDWNRMFDMYDDIPLYNVCYLDDKGIPYVYSSIDKKLLPNKEINELIIKLKDYYNNIYKNENDIDKAKLFLNMLGEVMFLFKSIEYGYEEEIRLLFFDEDSDIEYTNEKIPKIFVLTDFDVYIKKIIIGPRVIDSSNIIPYLQDQLLIMNEFIGYSHRTKIEKSKVHYK